MDKKLQKLSYHGNTVSMAEWVLKQYSNREDYKDNITVQDWLEASRQVLLQPDLGGAHQTESRDDENS